MENVCHVSSETHFFTVLLMAKRDHESISPTCEWGPMKIHGWLFHPSDSKISLEHYPVMEITDGDCPGPIPRSVTTSQEPESSPKTRHP